MAPRHGLAVGLAVELLWRDDLDKNAVVVDVQNPIKLSARFRTKIVHVPNSE